jgi:hypothetical protein
MCHFFVIALQFAVCGMVYFPAIVLAISPQNDLRTSKAFSHPHNIVNVIIAMIKLSKYSLSPTEKSP